MEARGVKDKMSARRRRRSDGCAKDARRLSPNTHIVCGKKKKSLTGTTPRLMCVCVMDNHESKKNSDTTTHLDGLAALEAGGLAAEVNLMETKDMGKGRKVE